MDVCWAADGDRFHRGRYGRGCPYDPLARGIGPWHSTASPAPKWCSIRPPVRVKAGLRAKEIAGLTWAMVTDADSEIAQTSV